jgi:crotonobetainyl-CoA:carnitine CoA-transferase CaiB-like acyl-CoA transferase
VVHRPPPDLGADNIAVLQEIGLTAAAIAELSRRKII